MRANETENDLIGIAQPVLIANETSASPVVLVCEHASNAIPAAFGGLGVSEAVRQSHVGWDPGAQEVARRLSARLNATLISGGVSRLVYDCNRPPTAPDAMPARSEIHDIPGNADLSATEKTRRRRAIYDPFHRAVARALRDPARRVLVTVHSFTPVYFGTMRDVDLGVLHDTDARLADQMLDLQETMGGLRVRRNQPYGPEHGVTHTLKKHAIGAGHLNVMLEIRNDLIARKPQQDHLARLIADWLGAALIGLGVKDVQCQG